MSWTVYILECGDQSLYTGITTDITRRLNEHNEDDKKAARYTRSRRPLKLVYSEQCENRAHATRRESQIKALSRTQKQQLIESLCPLT